MICEQDPTNPTGLYRCDGVENPYEEGKFSPVGRSKSDLKKMARECQLPWEGINDP